MEKYDHKKIEKKWQDVWKSTELYKALLDKTKEKYYLLVEFPYPSGEGLHVGHVRSYTALDIIAHKRRAEGKSVMYPIGWDAFGLPTENYAIKTGRPPADITRENTDNFRRQLQALGLSFDWSREVNTTDPRYYKWTQWIFLKLHEKGLAYKARTEINWCPKDKIGLANEEVIDGKCERCGTETEKRMKEQWMLAITKYADRLDKDLDDVDYLPKIKIQQRNWIGRSEGAELSFPLRFTHDPKANDNRGPNGERAHLTVFTTRPDTLFGATYLVLSPEHLWVTLATDDKHHVLANKDEVRAYVAAAKKKDEMERTAEGKEKTGVELKGVVAINPATEQEIPIYVADYVLAHYGTGAIMAVPAHDERDFEFAQKYKLPIVPVVSPQSFAQLDDPELKEAVKDLKLPSTEEGWLFNSGDFNGVDSREAKLEIAEYVAGTLKTTYKLRDWVFSRQRYWGEPIPMIQCGKDGWVPVPEDQLPVTLPPIGAYKPSDTGESPLAAIHEWVNTTCPKCGGKAKRETDTMPNWAGSSWYYLRYADPHNDTALASREALEYWTPVDWYNGGMEHTTLHLLYSRFWHKFLYDLGVVPTHEPYSKRTSHGLILAEGGEKMSKSKGNVVNPDTVVESVGADTLRVYEMFMGPFEQPIAWSTDNMVGARRFLERVWNLSEKVSKEADSVPLEPLAHRAIKKVSADIEDLKFNTAISALMIFLNDAEKLPAISIEHYEALLRLLAPFAPHMTEELWASRGHRDSIHSVPWPTYDEAKTRDLVVTIAVQINGKVRDTFEAASDASQEEIVDAALAREKVREWLGEKAVKKLVYVPGKLVSLVV